MTTPSDSITPELVAEFVAGKIQSTTPGLQKRIDAVLGVLRRMSGWHVFPARTETLTISGFGQVPLILPTQRINSLDEVKILGESVDLALLEWDTNGVVYRHPAITADPLFKNSDASRIPWPRRLRGIEVTLNHGYNLEEIPDLIGSICDIVGRTTYNPLALTGQRIGERQANFAQLAGGGVAGALPVGPERNLWAQYAIAPTTWEGG